MYIYNVCVYMSFFSYESDVKNGGVYFRER